MYEDARFAIGEAVQLCVDLRNDGSHAALGKGQIMLAAGAIGTVCDIGVHLNRTLIYRIDFFEQGLMIGCRDVELQVPQARLRCELRHGDTQLAAADAVVSVVEMAERGGYWRVEVGDDTTVVVPGQVLQWLPPAA